MATETTSLLASHYPEDRSKEPKRPEGRTRTFAVISFAAAIDKVDVYLLPAVFRNLEETFGVGPKALGFVSLAQALAQALSSPFWGYLSDACSRRVILSFGCFFLGLVTYVVGASEAWWLVVAGRAVTGTGLALIAPLSQSLLADLFRPRMRGRAFGWFIFIANCGAFLGGLFATGISHDIILGIEGWRFAFYTVATLSLLAGALVWFLAIEPKRGGMDPYHEKISSLPDRSVVSIISSLFRVRTFCLITLGMLMDLLQWRGLTFLTLWFQYMGLSDWAAAGVSSMKPLSQACGALLGGWLGDKFSKKWPNTGRLGCAMLSMTLALPGMFFVFKFIPQDSQHIWWFATALFSVGTLGSWATPGCCRPIFSEIVSSKERGITFSIMLAVEGSIASLGAPLVGMLAEDIFGFKSHVGSLDSLTAQERQSNLQALGNAILLVFVVFWFVGFAVYSIILFTYPEDRDRLVLHFQHDSDKQKPSPTVCV